MLATQTYSCVVATLILTMLMHFGKCDRQHIQYFMSRQDVYSRRREPVQETQCMEYMYLCHPYKLIYRLSLWV